MKKSVTDQLTNEPTNQPINQPTRTSKAGSADQENEYGIQEN